MPTSPLLASKLHIPRRRRELVERGRLDERLARVGQVALTLVSAPAGFGKSTLLAEWLEATRAAGWAGAWLSLDERDNDPALFVAYLLAAFDAAAPGVAEAARTVAATAPSSTEDVVATLLNDLNDLGTRHGTAGHLVVVLDDYHVIEQQEVHEAMVFLLEHLPAHVHLVIAGRADPALPLARLRARGELLEVRAADLRFTPEETAAYLNGLMGLALTAHDVAVLEARTEGWIAALQLAALSMQGRDDVAGFIAGFAGDDRFIFDYLVGEVLQRQPEQVRTFLLQTSILGSLTGSLCDAVTGQGGGKAMLETLERANLFVIALDDRRSWFRYHHLFADVLRARLLDEHPHLVPELHRRASEWYEHHGDRAEAVRHALEGSAVERAAMLIELAITPMQRVRQEPTLRRWLDALPRDVFRTRPVLAIGYVGVLMSCAEVSGVAELLDDAERGIGQASEAMVVFDHAELPRVPQRVFVYRSALARAAGDIARSTEFAQKAYDLAEADPDDHLGRGAPAGLLALARWNEGDLAASHRYWTVCTESLTAGGHHADVLGCTIALADIRITQGRLGDAMAAYEAALARSAQYGSPTLRGAADMHVGVADLLRERNDLAGALTRLQASADLGERYGLPQNPYRWRVVHARILQAQGDLDGALELLDQAERLYAGDFHPDVRPVAAWRARLRLARGELGEAQQWVRSRGLAADDEPSYLREFEHITLARVLLAEGTAAATADAVGLLERLLVAAEAGGRTGNAIEMLVVLASARRAQGDAPAAAAAIERARELAGDEGYVRVFIDDGEAPARHAAPSAPPAKRAAVGGLVEPLSARELDVLRLLRTELTGPEIARELIVSLHTVRTHTKNIFTKLGVGNRLAAIRRADELGL